MRLFFRSKKKKICLYSPMNGDVQPIDTVPDEAFANKMMGDGVAILPKEGKLYAPCDGIIRMIFPTKHAIGIEMNDSLEVMLHIGIRTVKLDGLGFDVYVKEGDHVVTGDLLITFNLDLFELNHLDPITPCIIMNLPQTASLETRANGAIRRGEQILEITLKEAKVNI